MQKHEEKVFYNLSDNISKWKVLQSFLYKNINTSLSFDSGLVSFNRVSLLKVRVPLFIYIQSKKRSTRVSLINQSGLVLLTFTVGCLNFKKSSRKGSFSAIKLFSFFLSELKKLKIKNKKIVVCLKGHGPGRRPLLNLLGKGLLKNKCVFFVDLTGLPFNGCRLKKKRRL